MVLVSMNSFLSWLYTHAPPCERSVFASVYGLYLRQYRYGGNGNALVEEALARDAWSPEQWSTWQQARLSFILDRAATRVPYYRDWWRQQVPEVSTGRRVAGNDAPWRRLANWPVLKKEVIRRQPAAFLADDLDARTLKTSPTGGTTGTPLLVSSSRATMQMWYALQEARIRRRHGVSRHERWAMMGGQVVVPVSRRRPPFWVHNAGLHQLYLSTHHLSPANAPAYAAALCKFAPTHLIVYPSSAAVLASEILAQSLSVPRPKVIFSNAELLLDSQREVISKAFGCPVVNTYGMGEMVAGGCECAAGALHLWPDAGIVEALPPAAGETAGELLCTGLVNPDMPLIRYSIGDRGVLAPEKCRCGLNFPVLARIEGRANDMLRTPDGRRVFWLNPAFYGLPVRESQIVQETATTIRVRLVPGDGFERAMEDEIIRRLQERLGNAMIITVEILDYIPRGANGKLQAVINRVVT
jgi:phenylacetate-CoA ligase